MTLNPKKLILRNMTICVRHGEEFEDVLEVASSKYLRVRCEGRIWTRQDRGVGRPDGAKPLSFLT